MASSWFVGELWQHNCDNAIADIDYWCWEYGVPNNAHQLLSNLEGITLQQTVDAAFLLTTL